MGRYFLIATCLLGVTGACGIFVSSGPWDLDVAFGVNGDGLPAADVYVLWPDQQALAGSRQAGVWALDPRQYDCNELLSGAARPEQDAWARLESVIPPSGKTVLEGLEERQTLFFVEVDGDGGVILYRACGSDVARKRTGIVLQLACVCNPDSGCAPRQEVDGNLRDDDCDGIIDQCNQDGDCPDDGDICTEASCENHRCTHHLTPRPGREGPMSDPSCTNGTDDDCDGKTDNDDPNCHSCSNDFDCDDANPCTTDSCVEQNCSNQPLPDGQECDDGSFCNGPDRCQAGACRPRGEPPCPGPDGDGDCRESCNEVDDDCSAPDADGARCDDGNSCTSGDVCRNGVCSGVPGGGDGTFEERIDYYRTSFDITGATFSDFDGDGLDEVTMLLDVTSDSDQVVILGVKRGEQDGQIMYDSGANDHDVHSVASGDFNKDDHLDLAVGVVWSQGGVSQGVSVMYGRGCTDGNCSFLQVRDFEIENYAPVAVATGDFNADGYPDLAVGQRNGLYHNCFHNKVGIMLNQQNGGFIDPVDYDVCTCPQSLEVVDVNSDGVLDILVSCAMQTSPDEDGVGKFMVLLGGSDGGRADGTFSPGFSCQLGESLVAMITGDFFADGILDVALASREEKKIYILKGNGSEGLADGTFDCSFSSTSTLGHPSALDTADFNGDGILDLVVAHEASSLDPYEEDYRLEIFYGIGQDGLGNGGFQYPSEAIELSYQDDTETKYRWKPSFVYARDLDRDGIVDIVVGTASMYGENALGVLWGRGACQ